MRRLLVMSLDEEIAVQRVCQRLSDPLVVEGRTGRKGDVSRERQRDRQGDRVSRAADHTFPTVAADEEYVVTIRSPFLEDLRRQPLLDRHLADVAA